MSNPSDYFSRKSRLERRAERLAQIDKVAAPSKRKSRLNTQNAGVQAVALAREVFDGYTLPSYPKLTYSGIRGVHTAANSNSVEDGVVTVHAEFRTRSGINIGLDVPIEIRDGELLEPSVVVHEGSPRVIAQSTFDDISSRNTIYEDQPIRAMYSGPLTRDLDNNSQKHRTRLEKVNSGMFSVQGAKEAIRNAILGKSINAEWEKPWEKKEDDESADDSTVVEDQPKEARIADLPGATPIPGGTQGPSGHTILQPLPTLKKQQPGQYGYGKTDPGGSPPSSSTKYDKSIDEDVTQIAPEMADTHISVPWDSERTSRVAAPEDYDADDRHEKPEHDRNRQDDDCLDPAERKHQHDLHPGMEVTLKEELEVKERGGMSHDLSKGTKCEILRDHAGDNKSFVVRFENGLEAIVERHFLKSGQKAPAPPKPKKQKQEKPLFKIKKTPKVCAKCNMSPCICHRKKKSQMALPSQCPECGSQVKPRGDFVLAYCEECGWYLPKDRKEKKFSAEEFDGLTAKVNEELQQMKDQGLSEIDCKLAVKNKYGEDVYQAVFVKHGPDQDNE